MLHVVVPAGIDDPAHPSGGNHYDRRLCDALRADGHAVVEHVVTSGLAGALHEVPDAATVLVDGLVTADLPEVVAHAAQRLRIAILLHMVRADEDERDVLSAASAVITTSHSGRDEVLARYRLSPQCVHVATPGTDPAPIAPGSADGGSLLCVGVVAPHKGHDVLLTALAQVVDRPWRLVCAGSIEQNADFVAQLRHRAEHDGLASRITFAGALTGSDLERAYAIADVLVHPSRGEMYGLVITEALAHGLPVIASDLGGIKEALAIESAGLLVPPGDAVALAAALQTWTSSPDLRASMRGAAVRRRAELTGWDATARAVVAALEL